MHFRSLQQKLIFMLLLPIALLLAGLALVGFISSRESMLAQWQQSAMFSLERDAHSVDMRLERPVDMVHKLSRLVTRNIQSLDEWKQFLQGIPGVKTVKFDLKSPPEPIRPNRMGMGPARSVGMGRFMSFHRASLTNIDPPVLTPKDQSVDMIFDLEDDQEKAMGQLVVTMDFAYLVQDIQGRKWWQSGSVFLVDDQGRILAKSMEVPTSRKRLGDDDDATEIMVLKALKKKKAGTVLGPGLPASQVAGFHRLSQAPWTIVWISPGQAVLGPIVSYLRTFALAGAVCILSVLLLIRLVTGRMARSVLQVSEAAKKVARGEYVEAPPQPGKDEIARLVTDFNAMVEGLKERDFIRGTFGRYVDHEVARQIMSRPEASRLGGEKRTVAIMMTDIRGFTPLCETMSPEETISIINDYLGGLIEVIHAQQGIIVDFLGDAILAFFDTLTESPQEAAWRAACCALELIKSSDEFNQRSSAQGMPELATAIGLNAGEVVVGNIGSTSRTKYGIVGGPVNLTSRLQGQAEGGEIIISQAIHRLLPLDVQIGRQFEAELKGVGRAQLYSLTGLELCGPLEEGQ